jgi:hypothetical protein
MARAYNFSVEEADLLHVLSDTAKMEYVLGGGVRLKAEGGLYPLDDDLVVATVPVTGTAVRRWREVMPYFRIPLVDGVPQCSVDYRLTDGALEYIWDGVDWSEASLSVDWNTVEELQNNFSTFPTTEKTLGVLVRLKTENALYTPTIQRLAYSYDASISSYTDEYVNRTLAPWLKQRMRPEVPWSVRGTGTTTIDLSEYVPENGMIIADIIEAYLDQEHEGEDIRVGYNTGTKVLTLSEVVTEDTDVYIQVVVDVLVALSTHADYDEISRVPMIILRSVEEAFEGESPEVEAFIRYDGLTAESIRSPKRVWYDIPIDIFVDRQEHSHAIAEAIEEWVRRTAVLTSPGIAQDFWIKSVVGSSLYPRSDEDTVLRGVFRFQLRQCKKWFYPPQPGHGIGQLVNSLAEKE